MAVTLPQASALNGLSAALYSFLPGRPHPYANADLSFYGVAKTLNLNNFWPSGSKHPAISELLTNTLQHQPSKFCPLIIEIVKKGMTYRQNKGEPVTLEDIRSINMLVERVGFKIPELWDSTFLESLPSASRKPPMEEQPEASQEQLDPLKRELIQLRDMDPNPRGFAFEKFLRNVFTLFGLAPRSSFRLIGEQIDGSLQLDSEVYLIEAKWQQELVGAADLFVLQEKVAGKSAWSRGLFISYGGFSPDGLEAFSRGRSTNIIGMNGEDLYFILDGKMSLVEAIRRKVRIAGETGAFFTSVYEIGLDA